MIDVDSLAAYSVAKNCGYLFNEYSGVTTNHAEGLNNLLKLISSRKELPLDKLLTSFYQLSIYYCNEIKSGMSNKGKY